MPLSKSHYDILEVSRTANADELKKAYKRAALRHHPDKGGDAEIFKNVSIAYDTLSDDTKRFAYDRTLIADKMNSVGMSMNFADMDVDRRSSSFMSQSQSQGGPHSSNSNTNSNSTQNQNQSQKNTGPQAPPGQGPGRTRPGFNTRGRGAGNPGSTTNSNSKGPSSSDSSSNTNTTSNYNNMFTVPPNVQDLSIRELKELLTSWLTRHDDCFEKAELIERIRQVAAASQSTSAGSAAGGAAGSQENRQRSNSTTTTNVSSNWDQAKYTAMTGPISTNSNDNVPPPVRIKVISLGPSNSGKSCLIKRFCEGRFVSRYISTIGVDYGVKVVNISVPKSELSDIGGLFPDSHSRDSSTKQTSVNQRIKVNFFDLSGHEGFKDIRTSFYDHAQGALLCYDVTNADSFRKLRDNWVWEARSHGLNFSTAQCILCANKVDLPNRQVSHREGAQFALENGFTYFELSSCTGENIIQAFSFLFEKSLAGLRKQKENFVVSMGMGG